MHFMLEAACSCLLPVPLQRTAWPGSSSHSSVRAHVRCRIVTLLYQAQQQLQLLPATAACSANTACPAVINRQLPVRQLLQLAFCTAALKTSEQCCLKASPGPHTGPRLRLRMCSGCTCTAQRMAVQHAGRWWSQVRIAQQAVQANHEDTARYECHNTKLRCW
jgi:hypothetical protein